MAGSGVSMLGEVRLPRFVADGIPITGVTPSWGPFAGLGGTASMIINIIAAVGMVVALGYALVGTIHIVRGGGSRNSMASEHGKGHVLAALGVAFLIPSLYAILGIAYGLHL